MGDGYAYIPSVLYWRGDGKTIFSFMQEVTTIHDGGALVKIVNIRTTYCSTTRCSDIQNIF